MDKQNITVSLSKSLLKKAKIFAAKSDKTLSQLVREAIKEKISESTDYRQAKRRHLRLLKKGFDLGTKGRLRISREDLHARR